MTKDNAPDLAGQLSRLANQISTIIVGKRPQIEDCIACLLAGGHLLIEDVPGVGKTTLAHALSVSLGLRFSRMQFTADLMPSDLIGVSVYERSKEAFAFHPGPVFTQVLLSDEINRAGPKTQSALLEAMEEHQVTVEGETRALPSPFFVIATQNPSDQLGTYPLPESQLDRFTMRLSIGYPSAEAEKQLMKQQRTQHPIETLGSVTDVNEIKQMQEVVRNVAIHDNLYDYILRLAGATRNHPQLALGLSPRGALALTRATQAIAAARGRDFATPDDVKTVAIPVMSHRLLPHPDARLSGFSSENFAAELLKSVSVES